MIVYLLASFVFDAPIDVMMVAFIVWETSVEVIAIIDCLE